MKTIAQGFANAVAASPMGAWLVRVGAVAPLWMKSYAFYRLFSAVARRSQGSGLVVTNLGLPGRRRVKIPIGKWSYLYGRARDSVPERATLDLAVILSRSSDAFVDIGAHEGLFSFAVAGGPASVHAFEPDPVLFDRLNDNLKANDVAVALNRKALGEHTGKAVFYRNLDDDASGSLGEYFAATHRLEPMEVEVETLADYLRAHDIHKACIKIDVEGAARDVWKGLVPELTRVDWLLCEMLEPEINTNLPGSMIKAGLNAYHIRDYDLMISERGEWDGTHPFYNWLFSRCTPNALRDLLQGTKFKVLAQGADTNPERAIVE